MTLRHASGETSGCCDACLIDEGVLSEEEGIAICRDARYDPEDPERCMHCGHTIEEVTP